MAPNHSFYTCALLLTFAEFVLFWILSRLNDYWKLYLWTFSNINICAICSFFVYNKITYFNWKNWREFTNWIQHRNSRRQLLNCANVSIQKNQNYANILLTIWWNNFTFLNFYLELSLLTFCTKNFILFNLKGLRTHLQAKLL